MQSLLYPNSQRHWWHILYRVFSRPYLSIFEVFDLDELAGLLRVLFIDSFTDICNISVPIEPRKSNLFQTSSLPVSVLASR